ncbi:MAG: DUF1501 domain-containing protein [Burkholderiaceae bacterium]
MHYINPEKHTRRAFLRRSGQLAMAGTALPFALNLAAIGEAAAFNATDYRALVCVFLLGGNDYANSVVTYDDPSYNRYSAIRGGSAGQQAGGIALAKSALMPTRLDPAIPLAGGREYALHPSMTGLAGLFNSGRAAVQLNVGPLIVPLTLAQYNSPNRTQFPVPPKLFSHNDQQSVWQSSQSEGSVVGSGGNMGDLALSSNSNSLFTCISASGNSVFLSGDSALQYQVGTGGAVAINSVTSGVYGSNAVRDAMNILVQQSRTHVLENEYNRVTTRSIGAQAQVTSALNTANLTTAFTAGNPLADQMRIVARLIAARNSLGARRQVFFVSLGGFDLHDNLISQQPTQLSRVSDAMTSFYNATVELGVANQVTAFTASDFGRTLTSNGDGSDHGWGSHHFMVGGAVNGRAFYGTPPPVTNTVSGAPENQFHVGQGRLLPTTAVDQYVGTLARWFGVEQSELPGVLRNINNFGTVAGRPDYPTNLGFMAGVV